MRKKRGKVHADRTRPQAFQARRVFHISPGDQLMVLGDEDRGLALVDARFFLKIAEVIRNGEK